MNSGHHKVKKKSEPSPKAILDATLERPGNLPGPISIFLNTFSPTTCSDFIHSS